ncbi:PKD domain-containing protein, partial [Methanococcoides vulcani]|uniref:PKD domain-containing protein n=1 Tax=Methanococcoides vulcani TaxID=1353158 RepID=UPI0010839902
YTVNLTVSNGNGTDTQIKTNYITVIESVMPVADFTANVTEGIAPLTVAFTDNSTDAISWAWDIDDNGTVDYTTQNPVHTYTIPGLYTVNLTVSNGNGTDTKTITDYITVIEPVMPVADFTANVTEGIAPLTVA